MGRIIKFRAWDGLNKKMSYWTMNDLCAWGEDKEKPSALDDWMQFTGLLDKNGKEIYEGDILDIGNNAVVEFFDGKFHPVYDGGKSEAMEDEFKSYKCEIIGNIYENKDLLNK